MDHGSKIQYRLQSMITLAITSHVFIHYNTTNKRNSGLGRFMQKRKEENTFTEILHECYENNRHSKHLTGALTSGGEHLSFICNPLEVLNIQDS